MGPDCVLIPISCEGEKEALDGNQATGDRREISDKIIYHLGITLEIDWSCGWA
jgi:hypothetical protein